MNPTDFTDFDVDTLDSDLMWYHDDGSEADGAPPLARNVRS